MGRSPCCSKVGLNRGAWTALEDKVLTTYIKTHGEGKWRNLPKRAGLKRCGKSCRLRWLNYLRPDIKRGNISGDEEELIIRLHKLLGNRWSLIAGRLPGRTDNEIKNYWNTTLGKKIGAQSSSASKLSQKAAPRNGRSSRANNKKTVAAATATSDENDNSSEQENGHPPWPQPIKTKAFRCTKQVFTSVPLIKPAFTSSSPSTSDDINNHFADLEAATNLQSYVTSDNNTSAGRDSDNSMVDTGMDFLNFGSDNSLLFDKTVLQEWSRNYGLDEDENATMDLGSFSFLLDCEGWP